MPIIAAAEPTSFEPTRAEIGYLDGIDRLDSPTPVILLINAEGIEVSEIMPGSRSSMISADSIISATAVDGSTTVEAEPARPRLWQLLFRPLGAAKGRRREIKKHDYILNIKYRSGDIICNAVFHREDRAGQTVVEGMARIISMLVKLQKGG